VTAWRCGSLVVDRLERVGDGVYRTSQPIPAYGKWTAMVRMEHGRAVDAVPIFLRADPAIPAKGMPATSHFTRPFVRDHAVLQREAKSGTTALASRPTWSCSPSSSPGCSASASACASGAPPASPTRSTG
jgi:hypothetical protein